MDRWEEVRNGFNQWLKISCYLAFFWVFIDLLKYLPPKLVDRIIEGLLGKLGI
jgi:hypothetical protein